MLVLILLLVFFAPWNVRFYSGRRASLHSAPQCVQSRALFFPCISSVFFPRPSFIGLSKTPCLFMRVMGFIPPPSCEEELQPYAFPVLSFASRHFLCLLFPLSGLAKTLVPDLAVFSGVSTIFVPIRETTRASPGFLFFSQPFPHRPPSMSTLFLTAFSHKCSPSPSTFFCHPVSPLTIQPASWNPHRQRP